MTFAPAFFPISLPPTCRKFPLLFGLSHFSRLLLGFPLTLTPVLHKSSVGFYSCAQRPPRYSNGWLRTSVTFAFHTQSELLSRLCSTCNLCRFALAQVHHFRYIYRSPTIRFYTVKQKLLTLPVRSDLHGCILLLLL